MIPVKHTTPATSFAVLLQFRLLKVSLLLGRADTNINGCSLGFRHGFFFTFFFADAVLALFAAPQRALAAFWAISFLRAGETFFILAFTDARPSWVKYCDNRCSSRTNTLYNAERLGIQVLACLAQEMAVLG